MDLINLIQPTIQSRGHGFPNVSIHGHATAHLGDLHIHSDTAASKEERDSIKRRELLSALAYDGMNDRRRHLAQHSADFLEWIWLEKKDSGPGFVEWLSSEDPVFWITGKPGSGKSTLTTYISEHERTSQLLSIGTSRDWLIVHFYFDFRAGTAVPNTLEGLLRAILFQVAGASITAERAMRKDSRGREIDFKYADLHQKELCRLIRIATSAVMQTHRICCFIDGLDEFSGQHLDVVRMIDFLTTNKLKTCVASRPEHIIVQHLGKAPHFRMQDHNSRTIELYVVDSFSKLPISPSGLDTKRLVDFIVNNSEGVILWAHLVTVQIVNKILEGDTSDEIYADLKQYPKELDGLYMRLLKGVHASRQLESALLLSLIQSASKSGKDTTTWALHRAMVYLRDYYGLSSWPKQNMGLTMFLLRLRARTGSMVDVVSTTRRSNELILGGSTTGDEKEDLFLSIDLEIRLFHKTLDSYLTASKWTQEVISGLMPTLISANLWLKICIECVLANEITPVGCSQVINFLLAREPTNRPTQEKPVGFRFENDVVAQVANSFAYPCVVDSAQSFLDCAMAILHQDAVSLLSLDHVQDAEVLQAVGANIMQLHPIRDRLRGYEGPHLRCCCYIAFQDKDLNSAKDLQLESFTTIERASLFALSHKFYKQAYLWITRNTQQPSKPFCRRVFDILLREGQPSGGYPVGFHFDSLSKKSEKDIILLIEQVAHHANDEDIVALLNGSEFPAAIDIFDTLIPFLRYSRQVLYSPLFINGGRSIPSDVVIHGYNPLFVWAWMAMLPRRTMTSSNPFASDRALRNRWLSKLIACGLDPNVPCSCSGPLLHTMIELLPVARVMSGTWQDVAEDVINSLIEHGADLDQRGPKGTPFETANHLLTRIEDMDYLRYHTQHHLDVREIRISSLITILQNAE